MIYISLENARTGILDRQRLHSSLPLVMPLVFEINKVLCSLNREGNIKCNVNIKIANAMNLEVKND